MYQGRNYVIPDDIKYLAPFILRHRIELTHEAKTTGKTPDQIINEIIGTIVVPMV